MRTRHWMLAWIPVVMVVGTLLLGIGVRFSWAEGHWAGEPCHSAVEALGVLAALFMSVVLVQRARESGNESLLFPAMGFLGMGMLDGFHAVCSPGQQFVLLHSVAGLVGGTGFALVWMPVANRNGAWTRILPWAVVGGVALFGAGAFLLPGALPAMVSQGRFTGTAVGINLSAGLLFLIGAARFIRDSILSGEEADCLFGCMALLFGLSGLVFPYSSLWDAEWWLWHVLRLVAFLLAAVFVAKGHWQAQEQLRAQRDGLEKSLGQRTSELERQVDFQERVIESLTHPFYVIDATDYTVRLANAAATQGRAYKGMTCHALTHQSDGPCKSGDHICPLTEVKKTREPVTVEHRHLDRNGKPSVVEVHGFPLFDREGNVTEMIEYALDITERNRAEEELRQARHQLEERVAERTMQLNARVDEAELLNKAMVNLLEDHEQAKRSLERAKQQLEAANKELEAFSYSVSHDLRAPLRSMDGFSKALLEDYSGKLDKQGKDYLKRVRSAAQRMGQLINDILQLTRVTRTDMQRETVDLSQLAKDVAADLAKTERRRQIDLSVQPNVTAMGDTNLLRVVLNNLMGNAAKFTRKVDNARVEFGFRQINGTAAYFVRDNGAGFDMKYSDKLFGAFQRLHSTVDFPGTGIGLATVQRVINRHGGKVWAEAEVGKGACFYFTLGA